MNITPNEVTTSIKNITTTNIVTTLTINATMKETAMRMKTPSPLKAIRAKCLDCCADQPKEVRLCTAYHCALWPFRMGRNPNWARRQGAEANSVSAVQKSGREGEKRALTGRQGGDHDRSGTIATRR